MSPFFLPILSRIPSAACQNTKWGNNVTFFLRAGSQRVIFTQTRTSRQTAWRCCSISTTSSLFSVWQKARFKALIDIQTLSDGGKKIQGIKAGASVWPWPEPAEALSCWPAWNSRGQSSSGPTASSTPPRWPPPLEAAMTENRHITLEKAVLRPAAGQRNNSHHLLELKQMRWQCHRLMWKHLKGNVL